MKPSGISPGLVPSFQMLILAIVGVLAGIFANALHPQGLSLTTPILSIAETGQCAATGPSAGPGTTSGNPVSLTPEQARHLLSTERGENKRVVLGDLRRPEEYARGHIQGAEHLPCTGSLGVAALRRIPAGSTLILYDQDGRSMELGIAAATASQRGLRVYTLSTGFSGWLQVGLEAESGTCEQCGSP